METDNQQNTLNHTSNLALNNESKSWKRYFSDFLMIFLAVTLGFIAENIREYFSDEKTGKEYAISLKEDLIRDTVIIQYTIKKLMKSLENCDTLVHYLRENKVTKAIDLQKIYEANLLSLGSVGFSLTDRTSEQLKNGGMRFISNKKVTNGIMGYWETENFLKKQEIAVIAMRQQARDKSYFIFDNKYYSEKIDAKGMREIASDVRLMTEDYTLLTEFGNRLNHFKNFIRSITIKDLNQQKKDAIALIKLIENEYK